jgi:chromosome segregation ATPase/DNA repair exonuclease SbcCD nuclease subunit
MKILLFSDLHINDWKSFGLDKRTGISRRLQDQLNANDQILKIAKDEKVALAICGGDVYHTRVNIPVVAMNFVDDFFIRLGKIARFCLVRGNHDLVSTDYKVHYDALNPINKKPPEKEITIAEDEYQTTRIRLVDYCEDVRAEDIKGYDVVVLHKQPAVTTDLGFKFEGMDHRILAQNNKFVFFGHYHTKMVLGGENANCFIMGSVIPLTFGDSGEHGVWILDTGRAPGIPGIDSGIPPSVKFIKLQYPEFITVNTPEEVKNDNNYYRVLHAVKQSDKDNVVNVIVPEYFDERIKSSDFGAIVEEWRKINDKDESYRQLLETVIGTQQVETEKNLFKGRLTHVSIENFISLGKIDLEIQNGFTLVTGQNELGGSNGSGKSSIFDAIYWCLFGETTKGLTGNDVVRRGAKDCMVLLTLKDGKDGRYIIQRTRKDGVMVLHSTALDGTVDLTEGLRQADRQVRLEKEILGFDKTLYLTSCYFSQEKLQTLTELSDVERTNMMTGLLGFNIYEKLYDTVKKYIDDSQETREMLGENYKSKQNQVECLVIEKKGVKDKIDLIKETLNERKEFIRETHEEIDAIVDPLVDFDAALADLAEEERLVLAQQDIDTADLNKLNEDLMAYARKIGGLTTEKRMNEENILTLESKVSGVRQQTLGDRCDACGSLITPENIDSYAGMKLVEINKFLDRIKTAEDQANVLEAKKEEIATMVATLRAKLEAVKKQISRLRSQVQEINNSKLKHQRKEILSKSVDAAFAEIEGYKARVKEYEGKDKELVQSINLLNKELDETRADQEAFTVNIDKMEFWKKAFSPTGVKSLLLDRFCNEFNQLANEYISTISTGSMSLLIRPTKTLKYGEERNKIGIDVRFHGVVVAYESLSGGEKKRVDIALCLALNRWVAIRYALPVGGLLGFVVLDEIFAFLDSLGEEAIGTLLYNEGQSKAVYVISHTNELNSYANKYFTVIKKDGISSLVSGEESP